MRLSPVDPGDAVTLTWTTTDAGGGVVIDNGVGAVAEDGNTVVNPYVTTVYTLTATGLYDINDPNHIVTATASVVVTVATVGDGCVNSHSQLLDTVDGASQIGPSVMIVGSLTPMTSALSSLGDMIAVESFLADTVSSSSELCDE